MLPASGRAPNTSAKEAPKPANWRGVAAGLQEAETLATSDPDGAIRILHEVLEFAPTEPRAWQKLGELLQSSGRVDEASQCLARAIQLRNGNSGKPKLPVSKRLAELLWSQGDHDTARAMLAILLLKRPQDATLSELKAQWEGEESR